MLVSPLGRRYSLTCPRIPDITDYIYSNPTLLDLCVQGIWLASRMVVQPLCSPLVLMANLAIITEDVVASEVPAVNFVHKNLNVFAFK